MRLGTIGVAISTTGDEHRLEFLETCIAQWRKVLPLGSVLVVTVDGDVDAVRRVEKVFGSGFGTVWQVGQREGQAGTRLGVAANKNTGIELLDEMRVEHLFLCDDDTWPLSEDALYLHTDLQEAHSIVCWGRSRLRFIGLHTATWTWPRGVVLYAHRDAVDTVGGMVEAFGPGGHEHVEWSRRIHNAGLSSSPFLSPVEYTQDRAMGARAFWNAEDMRQPGETDTTWLRRKTRNTTIHRAPEEWAKINAVLESQEGSSAFVPFRASANGRASATLSTNL